MAKSFDSQTVLQARNDLEAAARKLDTEIPDKAKRDAVKRDLVRVDAFLEDAYGYLTDISVSAITNAGFSEEPLQWRVVDDLIPLIVDEKFQSLANTDHVVAGVGRDQRHVAHNLVNAHNASLAGLLQLKQELLEMLQKIVVTEGEDEGVVLLSNDGPCHPEPDPRDPKQTMQVYDHYFFSPLGDALIRLHRKLIGKEMPGGEAKTVKADE